MNSRPFMLCARRGCRDPCRRLGLPASSSRSAKFKLKLLQQAQQAYQRFAKAGTGARVQRATARANEIADDIKELGNPTP